MIKRTVDISERAYISLKNSQMQVDKDGVSVASVPIEDLGILVLQHPGIVLTQALIVACQENNVVVIFCDKAHLPYSVLLPISDGNSLHTRILREQMSITLPMKKRLWRQIVKQKIREQARSLTRAGRNSLPLERIVDKVKPGDSENHEAQAAQVYWRLLMGDSFRRDRQEPGVNALLNYGYAILRAMIARSLVGTGLHPAIGLNHHNQYNGLCLADDLMEPFRPWIDAIVYRISKQEGAPEVNRQTKQQLLQLLSEKVAWKGKHMPFMVASNYIATDLRRAHSQKRYNLEFPTLMTT